MAASWIRKRRRRYSAHPTRRCSDEEKQDEIELYIDVQAEIAVHRPPPDGQQGPRPLTRFQGDYTLAPDPLASSVTATIELHPPR